MNENFFTELSTWLTQAGLAGTSESDILSGFCDRCVAAGLPLGRGQAFIDTLHPVHEGRMFRWGFGPNESPLLEYVRASPDAVAPARMTARLLETYLGRDAGHRVLSGRIMRGIAEPIDAVVWFSDLRGFTRITDTAPEQVIPLLNDYSDAIVSAIDEQGGDVLKLIGHGTLAIFTGEDRIHSCNAAFPAASAARPSVTELN